MQARAEESVSIIVPTFREHELARSLTRLIDHLRTLRGYEFEILVVDDSEEELKTKIRAEIDGLRGTLGPGITVRFLSGPRRGKGAAIRLGVQSATGSVIFTLDADLPVQLSHVEEFLETVRTTGADVVVGERERDRYANDYVRHVIARALWFIQTTLVFHGAAFEDTQCGFKAYRAAALRGIAERQVVDGGMYDLEYLYAATLRRLNVRRLPVTSSAEVRPSRIHVLRCVLFDPLDVLRLKISGLFGHYT